ncbi:hypothetical protein CVT25_001392 [Psilocybe cyanescens]|uniref:Peptidase C14 caspase domain-containing protein n=1 Tax=Psilocybe cyanescens TaxID=93625 RepID=A0A409VPW8_PSICY|nr:hypothetical protein CVT25_001392 [Psilocybe cyanescens]
MWNDHHNQAPGFPSEAPAPEGAYGIPTPQPGIPHPQPGIPHPQPGYSPGYSPSYGPHPGAPPSGYGAPSSGYGPPSGPPSSGYGFPSGPPSSGYGGPAGPPPSGYGAPPGHPPSGYSAPPGPPPSGYSAPPGPPSSASRGFPGQQYHQQHQQGGYGASGGGAYRPPPVTGITEGPPPRPPTQVQNYGPQFEGANHRTMQPSFQYSQCTGKKKALCIGINYFGQAGELRGCINDVHNIQNFITKHYGYKKEDIVTLTDDSDNPANKPTRENILRAMQWLVRGASPNDSLFFHYSGHGGQTKDTDGDEGDGYDEGKSCILSIFLSRDADILCFKSFILCVDYESKGHIVDDLMHEVMVKPLPAGCRLTAIFDYSTEGKVKEPNLAAEAGQGLLSAVSSYARGDMGGVFKSAMGLVKTATGNTQKAEKITKATRTSPADVISWSGCKDSQTSADANEAGSATGAMSYQQSYQQLLNSIREILKAKYSQKPQFNRHEARKQFKIAGMEV